jgi:hypothetical protein
MSCGRQGGTRPTVAFTNSHGAKYLRGMSLRLHSGPRCALPFMVLWTACAVAPVRTEPLQAVAEPVADCPVCPECPKAPARYFPKPCAPPPKVVWMPKGCPPQFGTCLSGLDWAELNDWIARCTSGR